MIFFQKDVKFVNRKKSIYEYRSLALIIFFHMTRVCVKRDYETRHDDDLKMLNIRSLSQIL